MLYHSPFLQLLEQLPGGYEICTDKKQTLTAKELIENSRSLAFYLHTKGVRRGDAVLLACDTGIEFLVLFMALLHLRTKTALVDPHMGNERYASKIKQFQPKWAFIDNRLLLLQEHPVIRFFYKRFSKKPFYIPYSSAYKTFATGIRLPLLQKHFRLQYPLQNEIFLNDETDDEVAVVYTSGTLAEPKAVVHTINSLYASLQAIAHLLKQTEQGAVITHLPQFALIGMMTGYKTFFWKETTAVKERIDLIHTHQINTLFGPPAEYRELMAYCRKTNQPLPVCLKHLVLGSAPVLSSFLAELRTLTQAKITCLYGMTEHLVISSIDGDEKLAYKGKGDLVGWPLQNMQFEIASDDELFIRSALLFRRYFHQPAVESFHATGDLIATDEQGRFVMKGRKKNMIIRANKNIYPGLYETSIAKINGVNEVCMLGIYNHQLHDEQVILVIDGDPSLTANDILQQLKRGPFAIDSDALPDYILFQSLPKSGRQQKVDLSLLTEQIKQQLPSATILS